MKKKTKDRARSKVKEPMMTSAETSAPSARGGRGRGGLDGPRGSRGRATDRGRATGRGSRGGTATNGSKGPPAGQVGVETGADLAANESSEWGAPTVTGDSGLSEWNQASQGGSTSPDANSWEMVTPSDTVPPSVAETQKMSSKLDGTRSWATLFAKPVTVVPRQKATTAPTVQQPTTEPELAAEPEQELPQDEPGLPPPLPLEEIISDHHKTPSPNLPPSEPAANITPSKDELTETNLEQVLDMSHPPATATAASTVGTTIDPRSIGESTPIHGSQQQHGTLIRPGLGGFATSAFKATSGSGRSMSFQRRVMEQQEAVVMPGNHAVDRAAVQFGSMGLNGTTEDLDVDDDREDAETRTQPPQHSPVAPRASLPPPQQIATEVQPTPRQAPGLPPAAQQSAIPQQSQTAIPEQLVSQQTPQASYPYHQFGNRYGPSAPPTEAAASATKSYETFGQQAQQVTAQQHQYEGYPAQTQASSQQPLSAQSQIGNFSSATSDLPSYYTSDNQRNAYQNYYGSFGQSSQQGQQDAPAAPQRLGGTVSSATTEQPSHYATSQSQQPGQTRYGTTTEAHSGHSTPNPTLGHQGQNQQSHHMPQQGHAVGQQGSYPYNHSYYNTPYYSAYMNQVSHHSYGRDRPMFDDVRRYDDQYLTHNNQFGYGGNQGGYGSGPYGGTGQKQGMYGQPHQGYGMSPGSSYDQHSASPANAGGYGQQAHSIPGREATVSLGGYGRTGSTQPIEGQQQHSTNGGAFGGMPDVFRSQSGYPGQGQGLGQQPSGPQNGAEDATRSYGDASKMSAGPSPAPGQTAGRPGSAANSMPGQTGLPSSQTQTQQGYGGYPSQMSHQMQGQQNSQYGGGLGGLGGHHQSGIQSHQGSGYGGAYGGAYGGNYYGNNNRGGWGGNYGH